MLLTVPRIKEPTDQTETGTQKPRDQLENLLLAPRADRQLLSRVTKINFTFLCICCILHHTISCIIV